MPRSGAPRIARGTTTSEVTSATPHARVGTLVLSHLIPAEDPAVTDEMWTAAARTHFGGHVIVAKDLMEL